MKVHRMSSFPRARRTATGLACAFVLGSLIASLVSDRIAAALLTLIGLAECGALLRRRARFERPTSRVWNAYLGLAVATTPTALLNSFGRSHDAPAFRFLGAALAIVALLFAIYGGGLTAGPGFRVPALTPLLGVFLTGFLCSSIAMQWAWSLGSDRSGLVTTLRSVAALGAVLAAASVIPLSRRIHHLGRTAEIWCLVGGTVWTLGQAVFVIHGSRSSIGAGSGPAFAANGLIVASAWAPGACLIGRPFDRIESTRPTRTAAIVMLAAMSASIALVVPVRVGWSSAASIAISTISIAQTALLAWFVSSAMHPKSVVSLGKSQRSDRRELRTALVRGELVPYYQPIYRASDTVVAGYECLVRWNHPRLGVLNAGQFLDVARDDHLLDSIDRLMMSNTLDNLDTLLATTAVDDPFVSVNIHPTRFAGEAVVDELRAELQARGRDGTGLVVELTEHTAIDNWDRFTANVTALQALGIRVAVDDFGMGNANYSLLMKCDPDFVKLDKVITSLSSSTERGHLLLKSAFDAASAVGALIVAEGIEDRDTMAELIALGADYFQGHALGHAQAFSSLTAAIERS
jgi:EAL domain-containing protein (putative c-di-GMP-specific phosphodiesterase class I)